MAPSGERQPEPLALENDLHLNRPSAVAEVADPMFVCVCHAVTDREIHEAVDSGIEHVEQLEELCGVGTGCGSCRIVAQELIEARRMEAQSYAA